MKNLIEKLKSISKVQILALVLIVVGIAVMVPKAKGMFEFYKEVRYAQENNFQAGNLSPDLIRPWMSIRYIAAAYAVPQKYLFDAAQIEPKKETSMVALNRLNRQMGHGAKADDQSVLMLSVRAAIVSYRAKPVATGLIEQHVEDWMTMAYIANCTGIPVESIFQQINLPAEGNAYKPLGFLSDELNYPGGKRELLAAVQKIVDAQGVKPVQP